MLLISHLSRGRRAARIALASSLVVAGCRKGGHSADTVHRDPMRGAALAAEPARPPYRVTDVRNAGTIVGRVLVTAPTPEDTSVTVTTDPDVCGPSRQVPLVERRGDRLENAVVWLDDVRAGKPLPAERRYEIEHDRCAIIPRVQAAIAGGMLNVRSTDAIVHRARFVRDGATIDLVQETDDGQVVPTGKVLARPGLVEIRCDTHPWTRAWILVFDHPYFAVTNRDGTFTFDSVPPGRYTLKTWQSRLGERETTVTVKRGEDAKVEVAY